MAERYSREDGKYGHINNVVLGNEIDYAYDYNNISDKATSLDVYMEEYSRLLRLTHMAISKYMDTVTVTVPTTHDWMRAEYYNTYKPKEIYDWLNKKSKEEETLTGAFLHIVIFIAWREVIVLKMIQLMEERFIVFRII